MEEVRKTSNKAPLKTIAALALGLAAALMLALGWRQAENFADLPAALRIPAPALIAGCFAVFFALSGAAGGFLGAAFEERPSAFYPHLTPIAAYGAAFGLLFVFTGKYMPAEALLSIVFYLYGFLVSRAKAKGAGKTAAVLFGAVPALVVIAAALTLRALLKMGASAGFLTDYIWSVREKLTACAELLAENMRDFAAESPESIALLAQFGLLPVESTPETIYNSFLSSYTDFYLNAAVLLPAATTASALVSAYISASLTVALAPEKKARKKWRLTASVFGIVLFVVSGVINAVILPFFGGGTFMVITLSLTVIYMPLMFALGIRALTRLNKKFLSEHRIVSIVMLVLIILSPAAMIAMIGAYYEASRKAAAKLKETGGPDVPDLTGGPFRIEDDDAAGDDHRNGGENN